MDPTAWSRQFDDQGGMRDYFLVIVCCWVVVVSALLAPAERVVARAQHTCSELRVQRNPSGPRFQRLSSSLRFQRKLGSPRLQCVMAAVFGKIEEFKEDWSQYVERLGHFFQANGTVEEDKKRSIFLTMVGLTAIKLLRSLVSPVKPGEKIYNALVKVLTEHYQPTPLETVQRYRFHSQFRKPGEQVEIFVVEMQSLAEYCNFGASLEAMLRDQVVLVLTILPFSVAY